jgi:hypothetical protein
MGPPKLPIFAQEFALWLTKESDCINHAVAMGRIVGAEVALPVVGVLSEKGGGKFTLLPVFGILLAGYRYVVFGALTHTRLSFVELLLCFVRFLFFYCG